MSNPDFHLSNMVLSKTYPLLNHGSPFPIIQIDEEGQKALCSFADVGDELKTSWFDYNDLVLVNITEEAAF